MIRRKTTPLLVNVIDRLSRPPQLFNQRRAFCNIRNLLSLQSSQQHRPNSYPYFTPNSQSLGFGIVARERPNPEPAVEETPLRYHQAALPSSLSPSKELPGIPSLLPSHNSYPEPRPPTTEEPPEVSLVNGKPTVDTHESGSATMDQNPNYPGFNGGWSGLNPTAPPFEINPPIGQPYYPPVQPEPVSGPANGQPPSKKKKKNQKSKGESDYLTPRQRRKAGRAEPQLQGGGSEPASNMSQPPSSLPLKPPPGLTPLPHQEKESPTFAPSLESGGIPNPSPAYLTRASFLPLPSPQPRSLLVVIDLNGTLLHRPSSRRSQHYILRPHAKQFLSYCIDTFSVVIWSSARPENVNKMCDTILTADQKQKVIAIWGRDKFGLTEKDYGKKVQVYKRLTKLWDNPAINPQGAWDQGNTVLIDDSVEKARSEPYNAVTIPEFLGDVTPEEKGGREWVVLPAVHEYLNKLAMCIDVSTYIRQDPFRMEVAAQQ
ncbi:HAD-like domain-containing protein [Apiosordaria backusii]|uniref:Mitochondrial import inner membrane translocase subunit TIM50 n=1 Tax=Apiosordaria backusii TaxID=314023 RepID=A0AA40EGY1_9PEZI|nr:HAD-like domain-containing protein [Apiosordaria backusii]